MKLYFARHGQSTANTGNVIWDYDQDYPLTEEGRSQALQLAGKLKTENISRVYCSPILRARETAQIVCTELGLTLAVRNGLREIDMGEIEGQTSEEAWKRNYGMYRTWWTGTDIHARIPGGENLVEVERRFSAELECLDDSSKDENLLLVSHEGVLCSALPSLLTNLPKDFSYSHLLGHTDYVVAEKRRSGWFCLKWQDTVFE